MNIYLDIETIPGHSPSDDVRRGGMNALSLFSGIGGLDLAAIAETYNVSLEGPEASAACRSSLSMRQLGAED